jgi:hypothetical protein
MNPPRTSQSARRGRRAGILVALAVLLLLATTARGQMPLLEPSPLGTHLFQNFLHGIAGLEPLKSIDDLKTKKPEETVLVVFGDLSCLARMQPGLKDFVANGGAVLLASDQPDQGRLAPCRLQITGAFVSAPISVNQVAQFGQGQVWLIPPKGDGISPTGLTWVERRQWEVAKQAGRYRDHVRAEEVYELRFPSLDPVFLTGSRWHKQEAVPYAGLEAIFPDCIVSRGHIHVEHPLFVNCTRGLVIDRPSYLQYDSTQDPGKAWLKVDILCSFPPFALGRAPKARIVSEPGFIAASSGKPDSKQRVVVLSGHSLFLNCALAQRDLDNATFATNTIRWLTDNKQRKYCLFVKDNQTVAKFDVPLLMPPMPTSRMINDLLRALEEENFFNRIILDHISKNRILRVLMALSLIGLVIYGFRRYALARHRQDYTVPLVQTKLTRLMSDFIPPLARRRHHALRNRDFREAARALARECFVQAPGGRQPSAPPIAAVGDAHDRANLEYAVGRLWSLATGAEAAPISADAFSHIVELVGYVKTAFARGHLRWTS